MLDPGLVAQFFVLINPFSSFPFLLRASGAGVDVVRVARTGVLVAFTIASAVALLGPSLFHLFGVSLDAFRIAGGIVLLLLGLETIRSAGEPALPTGGVDGFISIMATPLLTGPATISLVALKAQEAGHAKVLIALAIAFLLVAAVLWLFLRLVRRLNSQVVDIASRVLGLFLSAVAIEMMASGLAGFLSTWRGS